MSMNMLCPLKGGHITVEAVGPGHPDKVCDQISDAILDAALAGDPGSRVAVECTGKGRIKLIGEMTTTSKIDLREIAMDVHRRIGYRDNEVDGVDVDVSIQSGDIALGTNDEIRGAGDQGIMCGYAVDTPEHNYMPMAFAKAQALVRRMYELCHSGEFPWMRPDTKSQVVMRDGAVHRVTIAIQHTEDIELSDLRAAVHEHIIVPVVGDIDPTMCQINGTGAFIQGCFAADAGLTGRKIVVDQYGPFVPVGGGAFSGKDPSKVDRTAAYMARHIAKTIVAGGMAREALVQLAYTIGYTRPDSVHVRVFDPKEPGFDFEAWARERFDLSPGGMIKSFDLTRPQGWSYEQTARFGHFGRTDVAFPWERVAAV